MGMLMIETLEKLYIFIIIIIIIIIINNIIINIYIFLMFRTPTCPSSEGQIVLSQHLVLSLSVQYSTVQPFQRVTIPDAVIIQFVLLKMDMLILETCRG